jgi:tripartite-type tricarboxylate transporter receptor subunit TctC
MNRRRLLGGAGAAALAGTLARPAALFAQQAFPTSLVKILVPFPPGGTTDVFARLFSDRFAKALGTSVIVDNRGGAGGLIGGAEVSRAQPDGYTLCFHSPTSGIAGPLTRKKPPYDPVTSFSHVAILGHTPMVLAVNPKRGLNSLGDLVALLRAEPGKHSYGSSGIGSIPHVTTELFKMKAGGLDVAHVPYRGAAGMVQDSLANNIAFMVDTFATVLQLHQTGELKILSVFGTERAQVAPDVPTAREQGFDVVMRNVNYLSAPPGTPADRLERLSAAAREVMASPDMAADLAKIAYLPVTDSTPEKAQRFISDEVGVWKPIIKAANIEVD